MMQKSARRQKSTTEKLPLSKEEEEVSNDDTRDDAVGVAEEPPPTEEEESFNDDSFDDEPDANREHGKLYQDQLYGAKVLSPLAVAIIDTPEFQRLDGLLQLGFADVTYKGGKHTRFAHSVGTYFICRTIMRRIAQNHERLGLDHPGEFVSDSFRIFPRNAKAGDNTRSLQSQWRGLSEVVSAAALLHDLGHVPFGHTLEDEFSGIYQRHDRLAGHRLYQMLLDESSDLAKVFSDDGSKRWIGGISNRELGKLIYVILNWKEDIDGREGFDAILSRALASKKAIGPDSHRLTELQGWHNDFARDQMFHPFMSDIIGNTICSDLLDYLPRDRLNLGMEVRFHHRLQRYFTIRPGTLYRNEGLRMSIMVTRRGHGGQRRDVATTVLNIMRERYEMAERVYYHHKKAAASAMLAKLAELSDASAPPSQKPRDDEDIYPAPWDAMEGKTGGLVPHVVHMSDGELIEYLGRIVKIGDKDPTRQARLVGLQRRLYSALRWQRAGFYRTLMVIDSDLARQSPHGIGYFVSEWRGKREEPDAKGRRAEETRLAHAARAEEGDVILYCPSDDMQSKEVDARLEIVENKVLPLRTQVELFAYQDDVAVLQQYYTELWRAYVFVSPELFGDPVGCKRLVDALCDEYSIPKAAAYRKVRGYSFEEGTDVGDASQKVKSFISALPFDSVPAVTSALLLEEAVGDTEFLEILRSRAKPHYRLTALLGVAVLKNELSGDNDGSRFLPGQRERTKRFYEELLSGKQSIDLQGRPRPVDRQPNRQAFADFVTHLLNEANSSQTDDT